jgi:Na+/melibiose symporter-like transporter
MQFNHGLRIARSALSSRHISSATEIEEQVTRTDDAPNIVVLNAYWLGLSFMWNSIHPLILPLLILQLGGLAPNTAYGMLTFLGLFVALVIQPVSGALSDYSRTRWGRRRPWMVAGTALSILWLFAMVASRSYLGIAISYMGLQLCSNLAHGPAQGLIPDLVPDDRRGVASGIKNLFEMLGVIVASLVISRLVGISHTALISATLLISVVLVASLAVTGRGIQEETDPAQAPMVPYSLWHQVREVMNIRVREHSGYAKLLASRFCVFLGIYAVQAFAFFYFMDVLEIQAPARAMGSMMTVIGISVLVSVYPAGLLSERWGRKRLSLAACGIVAFGMALLTVLRQPGWIPVLGIVIGIGMGIFNSVNWAWATDLVPASEAGKYLGLSNLATAGSAATSRLFGPLIDLVNRWSPNMGYFVLFAIATLATLVGLWITLRVPETRIAAQEQTVQGIVTHRSGPAQ